MRRAVQMALFYRARGWIPVRVIPRGKVPAAGAGWQLLRPTVEEIGRWRDCNVGVLLGSASGWLVDVDLDCPEAVFLAPHFLPETWVFGRPSKWCSHWIYTCEGARSQAFTIGEGTDKITMLEIRAESSTGPGHQTVLPPSVHVSGEAIEWSPDHADATEAPRVISYPDLMRSVASLARATAKMIEGASTAEAIEFARTYRASRREEITVKQAVHANQSAMAKRARAYVARMPIAVSGSGGHDAAFRVAVVLVKGFALDEDTAIEIMREYSEKCDPPWSQREIAHKVASAKSARVQSGYLLDGGRRQA